MPLGSKPDEALSETLVDRRDVFQGRVISLHVDRVRLATGREATREVVDHPGGVAVLPVLEDGRIVLVRQYRHAAGTVLWEVPAGKLEPGETPFDCARRELEEETGLAAERWTARGHAFTTPGFCNEVLHLFIADGCRFGKPHPDEDEQLAPVVMAPDDVTQLIATGAIQDFKTLVLLLSWPRDWRSEVKPVGDHA